MKLGQDLNDLLHHQQPRLDRSPADYGASQSTE